MLEGNTLIYLCLRSRHIGKVKVMQWSWVRRLDLRNRSKGKTPHIIAFSVSFKSDLGP